MAVGADGVIYAVGTRPTSRARLVALSPDLVERWHLDLNANVLYGSSAALSPDGVLYLQASGTTPNAVLAIQTASPGLAATAWPSVRGDAARSNWAGGHF
jgi:hypothetical protein